MSGISGGLVAPGMECSHNNHMYILHPYMWFWPVPHQLTKQITIHVHFLLHIINLHTCMYKQDKYIPKPYPSLLLHLFLCVKDSMKFAMNIG